MTAACLAVPAGTPQADTTSAAFLVQLLLILVLLGIALANAVIGLTAVIGIPVGVVGSLVGGVASLVTRSTEPIRLGVKALTLGLGAMVAFGLLLRITRVVFESTMC